MNELEKIAFKLNGGYSGLAIDLMAFVLKYVLIGLLLHGGWKLV